jgi:hypothetical protein
MSNSPGLCQSFKKDLLNGVHAFSIATGGKVAADSFYGALYSTTANLSPTTTTAYTSQGEISASGSYVAGGIAISNSTAPNTTAGSAYWTPSSNLIFTSFTASNFDTLLIYNNTVSGKNAVGIFTFNSQSITAGTFTLTMPTNDNVTGLIRIA